MGSLALAQGKKRGQSRVRRVNPLDWRKRLFLSPLDIADALSIGLTKSYELTALGAFGPVIKIGRSVRVETKGVIEWATNRGVSV